MLSVEPAASSVADHPNGEGASAATARAAESGISQKKVKVYELRNDAWFDRGTGFVHGLYDEGVDQAALAVTAELVSPEERAAGDGSDGGGFVKEEDQVAPSVVIPPGTVASIRARGIEGKILLWSDIMLKDTYQRQQGGHVPSWASPSLRVSG